MLKALAQAMRLAGDTEDLVAVGPIMRLRRHADLDLGPLVEPPEQLGCPETPAALVGLALGRDIQRLGVQEALDCCQKRTSPVSRNSQPLPTMPCSCGSTPVRMLAWAVQVTAGITS